MTQKTPSDWNSFEHALREGTRLLHARKLKKAIGYLEHAYSMKPDHVNAALNLAGGYVLSGLFSKAVPLLESLTQSASDSPAVWINLGAAYLGNPILATDEQQRSAIEAFQRALELDPNAPSVHYNIGLILRDRGENDEAIAIFREALVVDPEDKDARNLLDRLVTAMSR